MKCFKDLSFSTMDICKYYICWVGVTFHEDLETHHDMGAQRAHGKFQWRVLETHPGVSRGSLFHGVSGHSPHFPPPPLPHNRKLPRKDRSLEVKGGWFPTLTEGLQESKHHPQETECWVFCLFFFWLVFFFHRSEHVCILKRYAGRRADRLIPSGFSATALPWLYEDFHRIKEKTAWTTYSRVAT